MVMTASSELEGLFDDPELKQALAKTDLRMTQVERDARFALKTKARRITKLTGEVASLLVEKRDGETLDALALALSGIAAKALRDDDGDELA
jgi:hypothetical protein